MLADAIDSWGHAPVITLSVIAYGAWLLGLLALLLPSAKSYTALRIVGGLPAIAVVAAASSSSMWLTLFSGVHAATAGVFALSALVANACAQTQAYGDEIRRPLRTPPVFCVITTIAVLLIHASALVGPLLLANGRVPAGSILTVVGLALGAVFIRAVHSLSKRFYVFVPAGLVVADSLTLADPVLLPSEHIVRIQAFDGADNHDPAVTVDTRIGATIGSISIELNELGSFALRGSRRSIKMVEASCVLITPLRAREFVAMAAPVSA